MNLFYTPHLDDVAGWLDADEAAHCVRVLRHRQGDAILVTNGAGRMAECEITVLSVKRCDLSVLKNIPQPVPACRLHIAVAPTKNADRLEWFAEKATEIGITTITPVICEHSERRKLNTTRLKKVVLSAMKQSLKSHLPTVQEPVPFDQFLNQPATGTRLIASAGADTFLGQAVKGQDNVTVIVGPEGDFTTRELEAAVAAGFMPVHLGNNRLRTETAALAACMAISVVRESY